MNDQLTHLQQQQHQQQQLQQQVPKPPPPPYHSSHRSNNASTGAVERGSRKSPSPTAAPRPRRGARSGPRRLSPKGGPQRRRRHDAPRGRVADGIARTASGIARTASGIARTAASSGSTAPPHCKFFRTRLCPFFQRGRCVKGADCSYAHSAAELLPSINLTKTKLCHGHMSLGGCAKDAANCPFAHGPAELRPADHSSCYTTDSNNNGGEPRFLPSRLPDGNRSSRLISFPVLPQFPLLPDAETARPPEAVLLLHRQPLPVWRSLDNGEEERNMEEGGRDEEEVESEEVESEEEESEADEADEDADYADEAEDCDTALSCRRFTLPTRMAPLCASDFTYSFWDRRLLAADEDDDEEDEEEDDDEASSLCTIPPAAALSLEDAAAFAFGPATLLQHDDNARRSVRRLDLVRCETANAITPAKSDRSICCGGSSVASTASSLSSSMRLRALYRTP